MKRLNNLYEKVYDIKNLELADENARKGKSNQYGVKVFDQDKEANLFKLHNMLRDNTYITSSYTTFTIFEPKEREIFRLPYFPDRIAHHAAMNVLKPIFMAAFTADTYSCIEGRGIHGAANALKNALKDIEGTKFCLKLDVKKFYPSVDHGILKQLLRRKIKDNNLLNFLDGIIDSAPGLPIGNYLSQYFANFYLSYFDHWIKEDRSVKYYFRYADDIVILSDNKTYLHELLSEIRECLWQELRLEVKNNYQVFPVEPRSIDFVGYCFRHTHIRLRKSIKQNFARKLKRGYNKKTVDSYYGWAKHCNSKHLLKKLLHEKI
jgi:RNA-directed DNA polymerase